jgi:hypothetical protein
MTMNPLNYASLEASKRLAEAGIVLETETLWSQRIYLDPPDWALIPKGAYDNTGRLRYEDGIPAPSMAEVWRELKSRGQFPCSDGDNWWLYDDNADEISLEMSDPNPTDALIDLLIWARKENSHAIL